MICVVEKSLLTYIVFQSSAVVPMAVREAISDCVKFLKFFIALIITCKYSDLYSIYQYKGFYILKLIV